VLFSVAIIGQQALAGAGLAQPPLCYFVVQPIEAENRNLDGVSNTRRPINHKVTTASSAAPLENRLAGLEFEAARPMFEPSVIAPCDIHIVAHMRPLAAGTFPHGV
jgi:hypothetical protein